MHRLPSAITANNAACNATPRLLFLPSSARSLSVHLFPVAAGELVCAPFHDRSAVRARLLVEGCPVSDVEVKVRTGMTKAAI